MYLASQAALRTGVSLLRPMYYDHPTQEAAYDYKGQYMFGPSILVAPVAAPSGNTSGTARLAQQEIVLVLAARTLKRHGRDHAAPSLRQAALKSSLSATAGREKGPEIRP